MSVSIVVPAYNEEQRLRDSLPRLRQVVGSARDMEVIIVDDGSVDRTADVVCAELGSVPTASLVRLPWNQGKGAALKAGVTMARGDFVVLTDADLSGDPRAIASLVAVLEQGADVAVGSRVMPGAEYRETSLGRKVRTRAFNELVRRVAGVVQGDTQCGFKAFRTPAAKMLFHHTKTDGFAIDVELLALARLLGYRVVEVPVCWTTVEGSRVHPLRDPLAMVADVLRTRRRCRRVAEQARALEFWTERPDHGLVDRYQWQGEVDPGFDLDEVADAAPSGRFARSARVNGTPA